MGGKRQNLSGLGTVAHLNIFSLGVLEAEEKDVHREFYGKCIVSGPGEYCSPALEFSCTRVFKHWLILPQIDGYR
jgi:hypothetical protein